MANICYVEGCEREAKAKGMCMMHYKRQWRHGDVTALKRVRRITGPCSVPGCTARPIAKGLCMNHYALNRRNGSPVRVRIFNDWYIKDGYRYVRVGHRHYEPEHRVVMERFLRRKLTREENVHHANGDILDNTPSNLSLVSRSEHAKLHDFASVGQKALQKKRKAQIA